jgi:hypothetical protein
MNRHWTIRLEEGKVFSFWPVLVFEIRQEPFPVCGQRPQKRHLVGLQQVLSQLNGGVKPE